MKKLYLLLVIISIVSFANAQQPFITTWEVENTNLTIYIPVSGPLPSNYTINYGDGTITNNIDHHTYTNPGTYTVTISGNFNKIYFAVAEGSAEKIKTVEQWGDTEWTTMEGAFKGCTNLIINATDSPNLSQVTSMREMFREASSINQSINNWDVSNITSMESLFYLATAYNKPLNNWDVSNVTNMQNMFFGATTFNKPLNNWNVSNVTNMQGMFAGTPFNLPLNNWNVSNVINMQEMFLANEVFNQSLNDWDVSSVTNMKKMFQNTFAFDQPLDNWDVSNVTNMENMFTTSQFNQSLNNWDVSNVVNMSEMFESTDYNLPLDNWDVSHVTSMKGMFASTSAFNQPLNSWDVSSVTDMAYMFNWAQAFNQPLNNWDVSSVTNMAYMFSVSFVFNQPLDNWNISNVTIMQGMFQSAQIFNQALDSWNVSNVTNMMLMFSSANLFNQPLNSWNVSNAINMQEMFYGAGVFNQPLNSWNVSNVINMKSMFAGAYLFNQDISAWNFNPAVILDQPGLYESGFLSYSGIDINNYEALLMKFIQLGLENKKLRAFEVHYCDTGLRNYLINQQGWTISGDILEESCSGNTISGTISFDGNNNGCDTSDIKVNNIIANAGTGNYASFSSLQGEYNLKVQNTAYTVSLLNVPDYFTVSPTSSTVSFTGFGNSEPLDFCLTANQPIEDLNITLLPLSDARPGFEASYQLVLGNIGTQTISNVSISLTFNENSQTFVSADQNPSSTTTDQLNFNINSIQPFENKIINIIMQTAVPPTVNGGDMLNFTASVTPNSNDYSPEDNSFELAQTVVNSFDPNDKQVLQGDKIEISETDEYLDYIIRFQNTGTASAYTVKITDELDAKLDWNTLKPVSASHNYHVEITNENHIEFIFNNINLPAKIQDEAGSNGFIAYKIKPQQNIQAGDIITGTAAIYFDYNPAITTNTVVTEVVSPTAGLNHYDVIPVTVYPNPADDIIYILPKDGTLLENVTLYNLQGRKLLYSTQDLNAINIEGLSAGIFLLEVKTNQGLFNIKIIKK
jgi:surface protein